MRKQNKPLELRSYEVCIWQDHWTTINALSPGKAKSQYWRSLDCDFPYTSIRVKKGGLPYTSEEFKKRAKYRQVDFAYCGMAVQVDGNFGVIVGHNHSANFNILFTSGKNEGQVLGCHPNWKIEYFDKNGKSIKKF